MTIIVWRGNQIHKRAREERAHCVVIGRKGSVEFPLSVLDEGRKDGGHL